MTETRTRMTRRELVDRVAFDRAEYELTYAGRESGWQPMVPFVHDATLRLARTHDVERVKTTVTVDESTGRSSYSHYPRLDWRRLAADVERRTVSFKRDMVEFGHEVA